MLEAKADEPQPRYVREVSDAFVAVFRDTFRLVPDETNPRLAWWSGTAHVTRNGETVTHPSGRVPLVNQRRTPTSVSSPPGLAEALAAVHLRDGLSLWETLDLHQGERKSALTRIRGWLADKDVIKRGLREALLDCPIPQTRLAVWATVAGDHAASAHLQPGFRQHLGTVYLSNQHHHFHWVYGRAHLARRALNAMLGQTRHGEGVLVHELARTLSASVGEINYLTDGGATSKFTKVLVRDRANRSVVRLRACPHEDCPAAQGHRWASHYIPVPETLVDGGDGLNLPRLPAPPERALCRRCLPGGLPGVLGSRGGRV